MGRLLRHDEALKKLASVHRDITLIGAYVGGCTKYWFMCTKCEHKWESTYHIVYYGDGCPKCRGLVKDNTWFVEQISKLPQDLTILDTYINSKVSLRYVCKKCGFAGEKKPSKFLVGEGCPKCIGRHCKFIEIKHLIPDNISSDYVNDDDNVPCNLNLTCNKCGYIWSRTRSGLSKRAIACPHCAKRTLKTNREFLEDLSVVNKNIVPLEPYVKALHKILFECKVCKHQWNATPDNILRGRCCPACKVTGYKPDKPATFYAYNFGEYVGFGITNNFKIRNRQHQSKFKEFNVSAELLFTFDGYGKDILEFETSVLQAVGHVNTGIPSFLKEAMHIKNLPVLLGMVSDKFGDNIISIQPNLLTTDPNKLIVQQ